MLEEIVKAYCAAKIQKLHILNKNGADMALNHQRDVAQKLGLSGSQDANQSLGITPFPSPTNNTNTNVETGKTSPWQTAALVAASVIGGAGTTALVGNYLSKNQPEQQQTIQEPATQDPTMGAVDIDVS